MTHRNNILVALFVCSAFVLLHAGINISAYAEQKNANEEQQTAPGSIYGKVTQTFDVPGYTYAEVDTGKDKVWAAGPITPLKIGDMITFSAGMPMENFHSKAAKRDFSIIYFAGRFITDNNAPTSKAAKTTSPHARIKQEQSAEPIKGIKKVEGGNTIAEIYTQKNDLNGKTIRVRGKVTKLTAEVMGKNWLHIKDSSTANDLTVTTKSAVSISDVVIIEGKLELNKDYSYGYIYPVIVEDAKVTRE